ncbi:MAG TPA: glycine cleavage system aminomethyltransferase GcvT [Terriglobia bacterium]|nr:glycine cleavage system aminomethyltransferase GcvT [Terriglobia bacterium]
MVAPIYLDEEKPLLANERTPLFTVHKALGARLIPFGGWEMPVEYSGIAKEHTAVRTAAGLFDVSHMGEFEIRGPEALDLMQYVTTNDVTKLVDGQAQYSAMAYPHGGVVDDVLVYRRNAENFMLVVNAANRAKDLEWINSHNRLDASVEDVSAEFTLLALQGPKAIEILQPLTDTPLHNIGYYHFTCAKVLNVDAIVSRTGYTGEDGFELYFSAANSEPVWKGILDAGTPLGLLPAGLGARNTLRLEARMLLYGNDMDGTTSLLEAGLGWIVKFEKGEFIGRDALLKQKKEGVKRRLVGFEMLGRDIARDHYPAFIHNREVGHVTSGSPSITLKKNIGLVYLPAEHASIGITFQVSVRSKLSEARVVRTPFYKRAET